MADQQTRTAGGAANADAGTSDDKPAAARRSRSRRAAGVDDAAAEPTELEAVAYFEVVAVGDQRDENDEHQIDTATLRPVQAVAPTGRRARRGPALAAVGVLFGAGVELHINDPDALDEELQVGDRVALRFALAVLPGDES